MTHVVITGGTGFIGAHLVRGCLARGESVTVIARPSSDAWRLADVRDRLSLVRLDATVPHALTECLLRARPDVIFHLGMTTGHRLAGPDRTFAGALATNVNPLATLLDAAAGLPRPPRRLVRAGSIAEYGPRNKVMSEGDREAPADPYGYSSLAATHLLSARALSLPFEAVTARLALTYGPMQSGDFFIPSAIENALAGRRVEVRRPDDRRDLVYVEDVVNGLLALADAASLDGTTVVNIGSGSAPTTRETAETLLDVAEAPRNLLVCHPQAEARVLGCDTSRMKDLVGWHALTPLSAGLEKTIAWHRHQSATLAERRRAT
jgi:nucleoside-diphosphate-sugar epimerase